MRGSLNRVGVVVPVLALLAVSTGSVATAADEEPLRVMSFNIRYGTAPDGPNAWPHRRDFLVDTITAYDPDLLGTQETLADQRDFIHERLKGYAVVAAGRDDGGDKGESAALFYRKDRFEPLGSGHFWLSETPEKPGVAGWDAQLPRVASWVKLRDRQTPNAPPILFLNTHFDHVGKTARVESARLIRRKLAELGAGCRTIVSGDFNAVEGSAPYLALFGKSEGGEESPLIDTYRAAHPEPGPNERTFSRFRPDPDGVGRIDWIAVSRDFRVVEAAIDYTAREGRTPSDHFPVTARLAPVASPSGNAR